MSCGSFYGDMRAFREPRPKEEYEKQKLPDGTIVIPTQEIHYSTLNPEIQ